MNFIRVVFFIQRGKGIEIFVEQRDWCNNFPKLQISVQGKSYVGKDREMIWNFCSSNPCKTDLLVSLNPGLFCKVNKPEKFVKFVIFILIVTSNCGHC